MPAELLHRIVYPAGPEFPWPSDRIRSMYLRGDVDIIDRTSVRLNRDAVLDTDTFFNRFPGGYWRRWSDIDGVTLTGECDGDAVVTLLCRTPEEPRRILFEGRLDDAEPISLATFDGGGDLWLTVRARSDVTIGNLAWSAPARTSATDVAITTFDRPRDVARLLGALASEDAVRDVLADIWVIDNGSKSFREVPGVQHAVSSLGERLHAVDQPNLGGSGGFSRGMHESLERSSELLTLMDDDIVVEPEALRRAVMFAANARQPLAVGLQMLSLAEPTVVNSLAESIDPETLNWGPSEGGSEHVDVARTQPPSRVLEADFNGWWACLLPKSAIREVGLSLPLFIKWDDAEYGVRLGAAGVPTVTLMGAAVWHEAWSQKSHSVDWTLYFLVRNRLIAAAVMSHGKPPAEVKRRGRFLARELFTREVARHLARGRRVSAATAALALRDFLAGPEQLRTPLADVLQYVRDAVQEFGEHPPSRLAVLGAALRDARAIRDRFAQLVREYGQAAPDLVSERTWAAQFGLEDQ